MAQAITIPTKRLEIPFFDGVNTLVAAHLGKKTELLHVENARSKTIGTIEKREGIERLGNAITATGNYGLFYFENTTGTNSGFYRISKVDAVTSIYYLNTSNTWTILSGGGTSLTGAQFSSVITEECCFLVNGNDNNCYIQADGITVVTSSTSSGHLYYSPKAFKINYYKDRLYVADYYVGSTRYKNGIMMSSRPVGIISLVDGDHVAGSTSIKVTDTKYIRAEDSLDVYRGYKEIETLTVSDKTQDTITVTATTNALESADELWVADTYSGTRLFRWAQNPETGINVKQYDTFKVSGGENNRIKMMENIGNVMMIANNNNITIWNDYALQNLDLGIGCVSDNGYVKSLGTLFFVHYTGIYATSGDVPKLISSKVQKYIDGATKAGLEATAAGKKGLNTFFSIGSVTLYKPDGSTWKTLNDVVLEYNIRQDNWYVHTDIKATEFRTYPRSADVNTLEFASTDTGYHIFEFLTGQIDQRTAGDQEILFRVDTDYITLSKSFEKICYPLGVIIETERGSGIQCFIALDDDEFYQIEGDINKGCSILKVTNKNSAINRPPRCRRIKLSIRDYTKKLCKISRIAIIYTDSLEEEESKD